ncbi:MAG: hypothetical protein KAS07_00885 [Candidatus Pacebacteria bacterium]|nr:hypothetical protein [Candidatus Paceibacterota bacterium]
MMHKSTKITPVLRKEIFKQWKSGKISQRQLAREYHVDKRVIGKIIERGKKGDFTLHSSVNKRYLKSTKAKTRAAGNKPPSPTRGKTKKTSSARRSTAKSPSRSRSKKTKK